MSDKPAGTPRAEKLIASAASEREPAAGRLRQALGQGGRLVAEVAEFLTRRKHARGGLYLPLVGIDRRD